MNLPTPMTDDIELRDFGPHYDDILLEPIEICQMIITINVSVHVL